MITYEQYLAYATSLRGVQPYTRDEWNCLTQLHRHMIAVDARRRGII